METAPPPARKPYMIIRPAQGWAALDLRELWQFRDLLLTLGGRDVRLRYRQTALGVTWVILQPLIAAAAFVLVFGVLARLPTNFPIAFAGTLAWTLFSTTVTKGSTSLIGNAGLVSKVYFPRLALPLSTVFSTLIDFIVGLAVMFVLMACYHVMPGPRILLLPVWLLLLLALGAGVGLFASALTVSYRDVQYVVPVLIMVLQYVSPVGYMIGNPDPHGKPTVPAWLVPYYMLNPLAGLIEAFRWSLLGHEQVHWGYVAYAAALSMIVFFAGAVTFKRMERKFADVI